MAPIEILWSDPHVVTALKSAGMPAQPDPTKDPDMLTVLREQLNEPGIGAVHRLDRPVSGVMLFGRTPEAIASLSAQFHDRKITKRYWAIVEGHYSAGGLLKHALSHNTHRHRAFAHAIPLTEDAKAILNVTVLASGDRYTLLEVVPEGGAFHQIRAQLSASGHPIKGDVKYGARRGEKDRSIALHARWIQVHHPVTGEMRSFTAQVPFLPIWAALTAALTVASK